MIILCSTDTSNSHQTTAAQTEKMSTKSLIFYMLSAICLGLAKGIFGDHDQNVQKFGWIPLILCFLFIYFA